jgi:hypothetical protein
MPQFGSNVGMVSQNLSTVVDPQGNQIVSSDNSFGASPLGIAARTQALYGIPNANFNLTPPDVNAAIDISNPLPYWEISSQGAITAEMYYDDTRSQWSVNLDPTSAGSGDFLTLRTRSFLLNDTGLTLRQKAYATLEKIGTYSSTNQWNLVLTAIYYDANGSALSTYAIGTAAQNATWTGINGFTTSGTAAIDASAVYCDLDFTMTAVATVSGTVTAHLDALLIQTSLTGSQSFLVTDTFTSSGTWTRPTGVEYLVAVAGYSAGNGGKGGEGKITRAGDTGGYGQGGQPGVFGLLRDVYVGDVSTVSVGIGAGGAGGAGGTATKAVGVTTATINTSGAGGSVGGQTTFGSYLVCATSSSTSSNATSGTVTTNVPFPDTIVTSTAWTEGTATVVSNSTITTSGFTSLPYIASFATAGTNGTNGTADGATVGGMITARGGTRTLAGTAGGAGIGLCMGGAGAGNRIGTGGGYSYVGTTLPTGTATYYGGSAVQTAGGGGGAGCFWISTTAGTGISALGGNGGNASANSGSGGGGGGNALWGNSATTAAGTTAYTNSSGTATGGNGGNGGDGYLVVAYIA